MRLLVLGHGALGLGEAVGLFEERDTYYRLIKEAGVFLKFDELDKLHIRAKQASTAFRLGNSLFFFFQRQSKAQILHFLRTKVFGSWGGVMLSCSLL